MATRPIPMSRTLLRMAIQGNDPYADFANHVFKERLGKHMVHPRLFEYQKAAYPSGMAMAKKS